MTGKQQRFVEEYLIDRNATQAAVRAGYSKRSAGKIGHQLLEKTRHAIDAQTAKVAEAAGISAAWVLKEQQALHAATKTTEPEVARKCLRDIGEHLNMYVERVESTNTNVNYVVETPAKHPNRLSWQQQYSQN